MTPPSTPPSPFAGEHFWRAICDSIRQAVVVEEECIRLLLVALLAGGHVLIEDVPGVGKTLLARAFSRALGLDFSRVQGTPDLLPSDILGASVLEGGSFRFIPGPIFTNVLLVDEINRATPRTQSALLEAMEERHVSIEGATRDLPDPFLVLATENPIELEGTFAFPEAQLDRFLVRIRLGYPSRDDEGRIARRYRASAEPLDAVTTVAPPEQLLAMREAVRSVAVSPRSRPTSSTSFGRRASGRRSGSAAAPIEHGSLPCGPGMGIPRRPRLHAPRRCQGAGPVRARAPGHRGHRPPAPGHHGRRPDRRDPRVGGRAARPGRRRAEPGLIMLRGPALILIVVAAGGRRALFAGCCWGWSSRSDRSGPATACDRWSTSGASLADGCRGASTSTSTSSSATPRPLPLPWLRIDDVVSREADIVGRDLSRRRGGFDVLRQAWSIGWFERVTRRVRIVGTRRRGRYRFVSGEDRVADLFGARTGRGAPLHDLARRAPDRHRPLRHHRHADGAVTATGPGRGAVTVRRRPALPARRPAQAHPLEGHGPRRASREPPLRPGPRARGAARGRPPDRAGAAWRLNWDEDLVEGLCVAALSLARSLIADGVAVGLAVERLQRPAAAERVPAGASPAQAARGPRRLPRRPEPVRLDALRPPPRRPRAPGADGLLGGRAQHPRPGRVPARPPPARRPGLRRTTRRSGPTPSLVRSRAARVASPVPPTVCDPDWRTADALERVA